jgi:hypothetical protein
MRPDHRHRSRPILSVDKAAVAALAVIQATIGDW